MEFELYLHYDSLFLSYSYWLFLFFILVYRFRSIAYSFHFFISFHHHFIDELRLFSHLGFTYTTYTTVNRE